MTRIGLVLALASARAWQPAVSGQPVEIRFDLRVRSAAPGEALVVDVTAPSAVTRVEVRAFERVAPAYATEPGRWQAIVGIDLDQAPGSYSVGLVLDESVHSERSLEIEPKAFPVRRLRVNPDFVDPPKAVQARIARESQLLEGVYADPAPQRLWSGGFRRPVPQEANSRFGTRSIFNGQPRSAHGGTDFLSPAGTPIRAPADGKAVVARDLYFSGRTVIIDHGLGVFSQLAHMSRIDVKEGAAVKSGEVVGLVGATGRVTGAHLHWGLRVGGARVDPLSLLALLPAEPDR